MRKLLLAGAAVIGLAGSAGLAQAQAPDAHVLTVQLPNGAVEQIHYTGSVPPRVVFLPEQPVAETPFAMLDRISAAMDRQMAMMMQAVAAPMPAMMPFAPPPSSTGLRMVAAPGAHVCMQSVSITYAGDGSAPKIERRTSGDCGASTAGPAALPSEPVRPAARTIEVKARHPTEVPAWRPLLHPAVAHQAG